MTEPQPNPIWIVEQAWAQVGRATASEDRARALSTFRRSISTAIKHAGEPTPELVGRLAQLEGEARRLYEQDSGGHVRRAIRALGSLRMAIEARLAARAGGERVRVHLATADGDEVTTWEADRADLRAFYGVPAEYADCRIRVQMHLNSTADVRAYQGNKIVWRKASVPAPKRPRRALPHEQPPGNGNGHR